MLTINGNTVLVDGALQGTLVGSKQAGGPRGEWFLKHGAARAWLGWTRDEAIHTLETLLPIARDKGETLRDFVHLRMAA